MLENLKLRDDHDGFLFLAESVRNPPSLQSHHHVELEMNLVVKGHITYVADGRRYTFSHRTLLWMFPEQEHRLIDRTADAQYYVAVFKPELVAACARAKTYRGLRKRHPSSVLHTVLEPESFDFVKKTMDSLMPGAPPADLLNREAGFGYRSDFVFRHQDPLGLNAGLRHLLLLGWRSQQSGRVFHRPVSLHPAVRRALDLLAEGKPETDLPLLANGCGVSPTYLSRVFAKQVGVPLSHYRNSLRLSKFWKAMSKPGKPTVTEAVYEAGFGSYSQFYKVYKKTYGSAPRASMT